MKHKFVILSLCAVVMLSVSVRASRRAAAGYASAGNTAASESTDALKNSTVELPAAAEYSISENNAPGYAAEETRTAEKPGYAALSAQTVYSGSCGDNVFWSMGSDGLLTIRGNGVMTDFASSRAAPWFSNGHTPDILRIQIDYGVAAVGNHAFEDCQNLEAAYLPASVTRIGSSAFVNCYRLSDLTIEEGLRRIGSHAFNNCRSLRELDLPATLTEIGQAAFSGCEGLERTNIPAGVEKLDAYTFSDCYSLEQVIFPDNLASIGNYAFSHCSALYGMELPRRVSSIGSGAFSECGALESVSIPATVTVIENNTFQDAGLRTVYLPNGITEIGRDAFDGCDDLTDVYYAANRSRWNQVRMDNFRQMISNMNITVHFADDTDDAPPAAIENVDIDGWRISAEITGEPREGSTLLAAFYDSEGRFLGMREQYADEARTYSMAEIPGAYTVNLFLMDADGRPGAVSVRKSME